MLKVASEYAVSLDHDRQGRSGMPDAEAQINSASSRRPIEEDFGIKQADNAVEMVKSHLAVR